MVVFAVFKLFSSLLFIKGSNRFNNEVGQENENLAAENQSEIGQEIVINISFIKSVFSLF